MDPSSLAASMIGMQAVALQSQVAMRVLKSQLQSQAAVLQLLQPQPNGASQANLSPGIGDALDITA
jgi:hypothetical protein